MAAGREREREREREAPPSLYDPDLTLDVPWDQMSMAFVVVAIHPARTGFLPRRPPNGGCHFQKSDISGAKKRRREGKKEGRKERELRHAHRNYSWQMLMMKCCYATAF